MKSIIDNDRLHVVLDIDEEIVSSLVKVAGKHELKSASFNGIGALGDVELGYFDVQRKEYLRKTFPGSWELVSLTGSVAWDGDEPVIHAHAALGGPDYSMVAGHLFKGRVTVTAEIFMILNETKLYRSPDSKFGLKLLDFSRRNEPGE